MRALRWILAVIVFFGVAAGANAAEVPIPPAPTAWVTDTAGFLSQQTASTLDERLRAYKSSTNHQILVYIAPTTGLAPTEDWTNRAFTHWKVGRKGIDDGLVLFIFPTDHKVRIEVGYGLEQTVPDVIAARIIRNTITPKIRDGQPDQAVTAGIDELLALVGGEPQSSIATSPPESDNSAAGADADGGDADPKGVVIGVVLAILIIVVLMWLIGKIPRGKGTYISGHNSGFTAWDALSIGGSLLGGFSGGGGGGGGFSGGGGMGGGGGATGSW